MPRNEGFLVGEVIGYGEESPRDHTPHRQKRRKPLQERVIAWTVRGSGDGSPPFFVAHNLSREEEASFAGDFMESGEAWAFSYGANRDGGAESLLGIKSRKVLNEVINRFKEHNWAVLPVWQIVGPKVGEKLRIWNYAIIVLPRQFDLAGLDEMFDKVEASGFDQYEKFADNDLIVVRVQRYPFPLEEFQRWLEAERNDNGKSDFV